VPANRACGKRWNGRMSEAARLSAVWPAVKVVRSYLAAPHRGGENGGWES
jgi:hypothetical protein